MISLSALLVAIALFLLAMGMASFVVMLKGCLVVREMVRRTPAMDLTLLLKSPLVPAVSVVAVLPDASVQSREFARRLLDLQFGNLEVVVALNRRSETDLSIWIQEFRLIPSARLDDPLPEGRGVVRGLYESPEPLRLVVVDVDAKRRSSNAALQAGVEAASSPVIALIDPECDFDAPLLLNLICPLLEDPKHTAAVCGMMPPPPGLTGLTAYFGALESLRSWLARCAAFAGWDLLLPVPGAAMLVRRDVIQSAGGLRGGPMELFLDLHALLRRDKNLRIAFVADAVSYPRITHTWADLLRRAAKDQAEIGRALRRPGRGGIWGIGWGLPALFLVRWVKPLLETAALVAVGAGLMTGRMRPALAVLVLLATAGTGMLVSMAAVAIRELAAFHGSDPATLAARFFAAIPENLGYRQVRNLWLIFGFWQSP